MTDQPHTLQVTELRKSFPTASGTLSILSGIDLEIGAGETIAITGPSGSGKSTLLYLIGLLDQPASGEIAFDGQSPLKLKPDEQARFRSRHIGFVFQDHHLLPQCTVMENVLLPVLATGGTTAAHQSRASALLERVGLKDRLQHLPSQLSGGERQRVAVCRALINQPMLLLADEPTGNLDRKSAEVVGSLLLEMATEQQTMLICVTHSQELAARFPRRYELLDGQLVAR